MALFGYRAAAKNIVKCLAKPKVIVRESERKLREPRKTRRFVSTDIGPHIVGAAPTIPDIADDGNVLDAILNRIFKRANRGSRAMFKELKQFIITEYLPQFKFAEHFIDTTFETFIKNWKQPATRKAAIAELYERFLETYYYDPTVKAFIKYETYPAYKHPRGIYSRSDTYKAVFGPLYSLIDKFVFSHPDFIKHTPVADRATCLDDLFGENTLDGDLDDGDYSAYECSYVWELFDATLIPLVDHILSSVYGFAGLVDTIRSDIMGLNHINFRGFLVYILCTLMSGEFITSSLNSFCNAACIRFVAVKSKAHMGALKVEGDDSLFRILSGQFNMKVWKALGLTIKLNSHARVGDAGFLSMYWARPDEMYRDPRKILLKFGWMDARYHGMKSNLRRRFLRCKALSIACETPRGPIVWALASKFEELTRGATLGNILDSVAFDQFERARLKVAVDNWRTPSPPSLETRYHCELQFGITVEEQLMMEEEILALTADDQPLHLKVWDPPDDNVDMYFSNVYIPQTQLGVG